MNREVIEVDLVPVPYFVMGEGEPVIMFHLPTSSRHCFSRNTGELAKHFKVILVDLRPAVILKMWQAKGMTLMDYLESVLLSFMDQMGLERATLIGGHKAGALAMYLTARNPGRVSKLVLYETLGLSRSPSRAPVFKIIFLFIKLPGVPLLGRVRWIRRLVKWLDLHGVGQWRVGQFFGPTEPTDKFTRTRHLVEIYNTFLRPPDIFAYEVMISTIRNLDYSVVDPLIEKISSKTLMVFGGGKYSQPEPIREQYRRLIKEVEIVVVPDARVYPNFEQAADINRKTVEFLTQ